MSYVSKKVHICSRGLASFLKAPQEVSKDKDL